MARAGIELNGVRYRWPSRPVVVVCIDGGDPAYFDRGVRDEIGRAPSELQSRLHLVCRLLLEKKKNKDTQLYQSNKKNYPCYQCYRLFPRHILANILRCTSYQYTSSRIGHRYSTRITLTLHS